MKLSDSITARENALLQRPFMPNAFWFDYGLADKVKIWKFILAGFIRNGIYFWKGKRIHSFRKA